jgi:hypothetical protein
MEFTYLVKPPSGGWARKKDMLADRRTRRDKRIFEAQIPGGMKGLSELNEDQLREKIMLVNRAREFAELTPEQLEREQGLREELRRRAQSVEANMRPQKGRI